MAITHNKSPSDISLLRNKVRVLKEKTEITDHMEQERPQSPRFNGMDIIAPSDARISHPTDPEVQRLECPRPTRPDTFYPNKHAHTSDGRRTARGVNISFAANCAGMELGRGGDTDAVIGDDPNCGDGGRMSAESGSPPPIPS